MPSEGALETQCRGQCVAGHIHLAAWLTRAWMPHSEQDIGSSGAPGPFHNAGFCPGICSSNSCVAGRSRTGL